MSLLHSIHAVSATAVIYGSELSQAMSDIQPELSSNVRLFSCGPKSSIRVGRGESLSNLMSGHSLGPLPKEVTSNLHFTDRLLYIYTSGTTGLPKAAVIKKFKVLFLLRGCLLHECYVQLE